MTERFYPYERRSRPRFHVNGTTVEFAPADRKAGKTHDPRKAAVLNISVNGLSFSLDEPVTLGACLSLILHIPGREPMQLVGRVKWRGRGPKISAYVHGVEFARYGTGPGENDPKIERDLKLIEVKLLGQKAECSLSSEE